ncbi:hypothetical protein ACOTVP_08825 [Aliarcobacter butzleri]
MREIKFINDNKPYNIMVEDERFMICSRVYTTKEREQEQEDWDLELEELYKIVWKSKTKKEKKDYFSNFDYWQDSKEADKIREEYIYENGEQPERISEDMQCYTIVDKKLKIRGSDNYYNKFNYLDINECKKALKELNIGKLKISNRNRIQLDIEKDKL